MFTISADAVITLAALTSEAMYPRQQIFDFDHLFTFEMANNHQGDVEHGRSIVRAMAEIANEFNIRAAVKLQMRDLNTFIHPSYRRRTDFKHIPRFISTALKRDEFVTLIKEIRDQGLIAMATPFDEVSVDFLNELGVEVFKVASCCAHDWPLLRKIAAAGKPIICSVGGLSMREVDRVVAFFEHRGAFFALMHCVAIYPTPPERFHLTQIELMKNRYPNLTIGFSTHEDPSDTQTVGFAYAKGARIFEKHVGIPTEKYKLNAYSATPQQVRLWLEGYQRARRTCGEGEREVPREEISDLRSLMRGVYANKRIEPNSPIKREDVFFAMPLLGDQHMRSGRFREGFLSDKRYLSGEPINRIVEPRRPTRKDILYFTINEVKAMLNQARIPLSHDYIVEISHHRGLERFHETGCVIVECFNREYAKKLVIQIKGQSHPIHYHKLKDETFHVLSGSVEVDVEGRGKLLLAGDTLWIPRGVWHGFRTNSGVILEEISTTSHDSRGDSYYIDPSIASIPREERKTKLLNWGRHQFDDLYDE